MKSDEAIESERAAMEPHVGPTKAEWYAEACRLEYDANPDALLWACRVRELVPDAARAIVGKESLAAKLDAEIGAHGRLRAENAGLRADAADAAAFVRAFRQACEVKQTTAWPPAAQEAWAVLYEVVRDSEAGLKVLAENAQLHDTLKSFADRIAGQSEALSIAARGPRARRLAALEKVAAAAREFLCLLRSTITPVAFKAESEMDLNEAFAELDELDKPEDRPCAE